MAKKGNLSKPQEDVYTKSKDMIQKPYTEAALNAILGSSKGFYFTKTQIKKLGDLMASFPADGLWFVLGKSSITAKKDSNEGNIEIIPIDITSGGQITIYEGKDFRGEILFELGGLSNITNLGVNRSQGTEGVAQRTPPPFPR